MENIIKKRIENFKATRDCIEDENTINIYTAKIELLESIMEEALTMRVVGRSFDE